MMSIQTIRRVFLFHVEEQTVEQWERVKRQLSEGVDRATSDLRNGSLREIDRYTRLVCAALYAQVLAWIGGHVDIVPISRADDL